MRLWPRGWDDASQRTRRASISPAVPSPLIAGADIHGAAGGILLLRNVFEVDSPWGLMRTAHQTKLRNAAEEITKRLWGSHSLAWIRIADWIDGDPERAYNVVQMLRHHFGGCTAPDCRHDPGWE